MRRSIRTNAAKEGGPKAGICTKPRRIAMNEDLRDAAGADSDGGRAGESGEMVHQECESVAATA